MKIISFISLMLICGLGGAGCSKSTPGDQATGMHQDVAPHGGAIVPLGENYHLELVRDAET